MLGTNMYAYALNNPVNHEDSEGNLPKLLKKVASAVKSTAKKVAKKVKKVLKKAAKLYVKGVKKTIDMQVQGMIYYSNPLGAMISRKVHYSRNVFNKSYSETELLKNNYDPVGNDEAKFHQNHTQNGKPNRKYVVGDWFSSEIVFYDNGEINNTAEDGGTFNVYQGNNRFLQVAVHGSYDVIPYVIWGNALDDSTTIVDRVIMMF